MTSCDTQTLDDLRTQFESQHYQIHFVDVDRLTPPTVSNVHGVTPSDRSDQLRLHLEHLTTLISPDTIYFPRSGGLAFRSIQAKRCGSTFQNTTFRFYGPLSTHSWPDNEDDLEKLFMEHYSAQYFQHPQPHQVSMHQSLTLPLVSVCVPYFNMGHFLPSTLRSLAHQTYQSLEVIVIDDGSTDPSSIVTFRRMESTYPQFQFHSQVNSGIGATRNRGLYTASGQYFLPFDADNIAHPEMVSRLVQAIERRPDLAALSCYYAAFSDESNLERDQYLYACRPTGGPHVLGCLRNVYGDASSIFRTQAFRSVGGFETDRGTSYEDWEAFVKLVNAGYQVDVLPEVLFYYRHLPTGFSRVTDPSANRERVLRQYRRLERLPPHEQEMLWSALAGLHQRACELTARQNSLRYRLVDRAYSASNTLSGLLRTMKALFSRLVGTRRT